MKTRGTASSLDRRQFLASTSIIALSQIATRAETADDPRSLAAHIHPDVKYVRTELPREDNAFWDWKDATDKMTSLHDFAETYFRKNIENLNDNADEFDFQDAVATAEHLSSPFPQGDAGSCVRAWLDASKESIMLVDRGIARARYQVPQEHLLAFLDDANTMEEVPIPRNAARLKATVCSSCLSRGEQAPSAKALMDLLRVANMALNGDGYLVHYLVAMGVHTIAMNAVPAFAFHPQTSLESLHEIRRLLLQTRPESQSLARVFRVEVVYYTQHEVSRLPQTGDLRQLVDALIKRHLVLGGDDPNAMFSNSEQVARVQAGLLKLFDGHPKPFDAEDTMRIYSSVVATMLNDLLSPWLDRKQDITKAWLEEIKPWPEPLSFINDLSYTLFLGNEKEERDVTDKEIDEARKKLHRVQNPIGKQMLHYAGAFDGVRRSYHIGRLRSEIGGLFIACRLFRDKELRLPRHLSELVNAELVESVPIDPFSGQEVRYDPQRRLIWSFGENEVDDSGNWDFDAEVPDGNDLVWRIPA